ncbi:MAG: CRTAC1 family protein [Planctomycetota bacterium]|nr:CRTAC1 family protein [Planctomycetota bacterium]
MRRFKLSVKAVLVVSSLVALTGGCNHFAEPDVTPPTAAVSAIDSTAGFTFVEVAGSGVQFAYRNGEETNHCAILESLGGGISALDFDRDGWMDLCIPGGGIFTDDKRVIGLPTGLFRNRGDWHFTAAAEASGVATSPNYSHAAIVGDYNNDGFPDILLTGYGGVLLWTNLGDGTFVESAPRAELDAHRWSSTAAWGDLDGDGTLDLYIANYVDWSFDNDPICMIGMDTREICSPKRFEPLSDQVFYNNGDGTFRAAGDDAGLRADGKGLGVLIADFDNDGDVDVYTANDTTPNFLYLNDGQGQFEEVGMLRGTALDDQGVSNGSMGVDLCDYNKDGLVDLWVANFEVETFALYRNEGQAFFLHASQSAGVTAIGQLFVGFGTVCADFDRDGDEDIVVSNGHAVKYPRASPRRQLPLCLENRESRFYRSTFPPQSYFSQDHEGRGLTAVDFDNDGDLDLAVSHLNDPVALLRNDCQSGTWVGVQLIGVDSNRDAVGTRLLLQTDQGDIVRHVKGGGSYLSACDPRVYWGVADGTHIESLTIHWPSGTTQVISEPNAGRLLRIVEEPIHDDAL